MKHKSKFSKFPHSFKIRKYTLESWSKTFDRIKCLFKPFNFTQSTDMSFLFGKTWFCDKRVLIWLRQVNFYKINSSRFSKVIFKTKSLWYMYWRRSGVFVINSEYVSHLVLAFLLLSLSREMPAGINLQEWSCNY